LLPEVSSLVTPAQIKEIHPYLNVEDLQGEVYCPDDAVADPNALNDALIAVAKKNGVRFRE
jgi:glycine/D-amino acid oxidase-like deaminating enzyme